MNTKRDFAASDLSHLVPCRLDASINETFLLHGTKPESLLTVLSNGLSEKFSDGLFGEGICKSFEPHTFAVATSRHVGVAFVAWQTWLRPQQRTTSTR